MAYPTKATARSAGGGAGLLSPTGLSFPNPDSESVAADEQAQLLITDPAVIEPSVLLVNTLLALVAALNHGIRQLEKAIEEVVAVHPDYSIFASFPGAGPALAPRLVTAFGSRERYQSASKCNRSAASRRSCRPVGASAGSIFGGPVPNFCGRPCHEYAALSVPHSPWAKAFYEKQKGKR